MPKKRARSDKKKAAKSAEAFSHLVVCLSGTLSLPRSEFQEFVKSNGGQCKSSVTKAVTHLVSTNEELHAATSKVIKAQSFGIPIVNEVCPLYILLCIGMLVQVYAYSQHRILFTRR